MGPTQAAAQAPRPPDPPSGAAPERASANLRLTLVEPAARWRLEEDDVPETPLHDAIIQTLLLVLKYWAVQQGRSALVTSNLACRWDPADARVGTDPDVVVVEPAPPNAATLPSLRVWEPGHSPPRVAVEIVSDGSAEKDYLEAAARCTRLGVRELWVFDPLLCGPSTTGGPYRLQVWRQQPNDEGALVRVHAGEPPAWSEELQGYLVIPEGEGHLRLSTDAAGEQLWPTEADAERARADDERTRADAAEAEIARLKRLLAER